MIRTRARRRILFVIDDMGVGGAQKQVREVVNRLDPERFEADIVCLEAGGFNLDRAHGAGRKFVLNARRLYDNLGVAAAVRLAGIIHEGGYDLVEAYLPSAHLLCAMALGAGRRPALVAARRHTAGLDPLWMKAASPLLNRVTHFSIANSLAVRESVAKRYRIRRSRIAVVPNVVAAVGEKRPREGAKAALGLDSRDYVVAAVGSFSQVKDYPTILRAFASFSKDALPARLLLAGDGKQRKRAAALGAALGLNGNLRFLETVEDAGEVLAAADVFVHASRSEGLSNAVLEAMSAGLPVVASDIGANREALGDDCGVFFTPGDWRGCLAGLRLFAEDRCAGARAGQNAVRRAREMFGDAAMRRRERLYERICEVVDVNGT